MLVFHFCSFTAAILKVLVGMIKVSLIMKNFIWQMGAVNGSQKLKKAVIV